MVKMVQTKMFGEKTVSALIKSVNDFIDGGIAEISEVDSFDDETMFYCTVTILEDNGEF